MLGDLVAIGGSACIAGHTEVDRVDGHRNEFSGQNRVRNDREVDGIVAVWTGDARAGQEEAESVVHRATDVFIVLLGSEDVVENQGVTGGDKVKFEDGGIVGVERAQGREVIVSGSEVAAAQSGTACIVRSDGHIDVARGQHDAVRNLNVGGGGVEAADLVEVAAEGDVAHFHTFTQQEVHEGLFRRHGVVRDQLGLGGQAEGQQESKQGEGEAVQVHDLHWGEKYGIARHGLG